MVDEIDETNSEQSDKNWKLARDKIAKLEALVGKLQPLAINGLAHRAGFDVNSGATKLLLEKYASQFDPDEATPDGFVEFAKGYDIAPNLTASNPAPPAEQDRTNENQMEQLQAGADRLAAQGAVQEPVDEVMEKIAQAEASGDVATSLALKLQTMMAAD